MWICSDAAVEMKVEVGPIETSGHLALAEAGPKLEQKWMMSGDGRWRWW